MLWKHELHFGEQILFGSGPGPTFLIQSLPLIYHSAGQMSTHSPSFKYFPYLQVEQSFIFGPKHFSQPLLQG